MRSTCCDCATSSGDVVSLVGSWAGLVYGNNMYVVTSSGSLDIQRSGGGVLILLEIFHRIVEDKCPRVVAVRELLQVPSPSE